jgi:hypothetical protein
VKATRVVLLAVGVVAIAAIAKKWLRPDLYVPEVPSAPPPEG